MLIVESGSLKLQKILKRPGANEYGSYDFFFYIFFKVLLESRNNYINYLASTTVHILRLKIKYFICLSFTYLLTIYPAPTQKIILPFPEENIFIFIRLKCIFISMICVVLNF